MRTFKLFGGDPPWWRGLHGEWYVLGQVALLVLVAFGPQSLPGASGWAAPYNWLGWVLGIVLLLVGSSLATMGAFWLGANLTPLPRPKDEATLVESGPYRFVRHPIYSGLICMAIGWGLLVHGVLTLGYALVLAVYLDFKARREERWLVEKFPRYRAYQKRVRKLIPFVY